jgi:hypothetical protein
MATILKDGIFISDRDEINLITGSNIILTVQDNAGSNRTDVTISSSGSGGGAVSSVDGHTGTVVLTASDIESNLGFTPENAVNRNTANGYCPLDANGRVPVANLPTSSGSSGSSISNTHGSASIDSDGNLVISGDIVLQGRFKKITGIVTGPDHNGVGVTRIASGYTYHGADIGGVAPFVGQRFSTTPGGISNGGALLYYPQLGTIDPASWIDMDWTAEVITPGSAQPGSVLRVHMAWKSASGFYREKDVLTGFDVSILGNFVDFDLGCLPHDATPDSSGNSYGIWYWITSDGSLNVTDSSNMPTVILYPHVVQH